MQLSPTWRTVGLRVTLIDYLSAHVLHFVLSLLTVQSRSSLRGRCAVLASLAQAEAQPTFYVIRRQPLCYDKAHRCTRSRPFSDTVLSKPPRFMPK